MNNILQLKGHFDSDVNHNSGGNSKLPAKAILTSSHVKNLIDELETIYEKWNADKVLEGALFNVYYIKLLAKSNRVSKLFSSRGIPSNATVRGAAFYTDNEEIKHVFTHYVKLNVLVKTINDMKKCLKILDSSFAGSINDTVLDQINKGEIKLLGISKTNFASIVKDCYYVSEFKIDTDLSDINEAAIITIYKTNVDTKTLLSKFGIKISKESIMDDDTTFRLDPRDLQILKSKAPYLIAMEVKDLSRVVPENFNSINQKNIFIPSPTNEPTIGVIDTLFDDSVYFSEWVTYEKMINSDIPTTSDDAKHGTAISSLIVDGPSFNPDYNDNCGRFRVKHFGVATSGAFSSFTVLRLIRQAVINNPNIKVWNLSLGSCLEINPNFISPEAAELDKIQYENDVIFIIAGTNAASNYNFNEDLTKKIKIGSPADSLNSIVVNAVDRYNNPASYTRVGPVLSFFLKPDVSYFGGDINGYVNVCEPLGSAEVCGTSFAAPWITRKVAYLIYKMGLNRETAKALIIDSAAGWNRKDTICSPLGYGVVPIKIEDILKSPKDEIKFIITDEVQKYETSNYSLPVPLDNGKFPFYAKATFCYFPECSRIQGVDYTNTELHILFGRIKIEKGNPKVYSITSKKIEEVKYEKDYRNFYRKWDNVKHIEEHIPKKTIARKSFDSNNWGINIKTMERLYIPDNRHIKFGLVVTLKEMNGQNRINKFKQLCAAKNWIVQEIDIDAQIKVYNISEEEIKFD